MNKVVLIGRLTADPELKTTNSGTSVCSFTAAVNRRFADANGERKADFINCVAWRQTAEFISKYFAKGGMIGVIGSIQTRSWEDQKGNKRYTTEVLIEEVYFTESKSGGQAKRDIPGGLPEGDFMPGAIDEDLPF